jgi:Na+-driven multidrug efflux pump
MRFVFGSGVAGVAVASLAAVLGTLWYAVPLYRRITEADAPPEHR